MGLLEREKVFRFRVNDHIMVTEIVEKWKTPYEFDDLAFKNAVYGEISVKIKDLQLQVAVLKFTNRTRIIAV